DSCRPESLPSPDPTPSAELPATALLHHVVRAKWIGARPPAHRQAATTDLPALFGCGRALHSASRLAAPGAGCRPRSKAEAAIRRPAPDQSLAAAGPAAVRSG